MELPSEIPVMTLPNAILFPQAMLPLYIFEPRYRKMLEDSLNSHRMFSVAFQKPGRSRETPSSIAGIGLIRASVGNKDGTSHLVLQGLARVELRETIRYKPYRIQKVRPVKTTKPDTVVVDALTAKALELVGERLAQGVELPPHILKQLSVMQESKKAGSKPDFQAMAKFLLRTENPEFLADLVSCLLLPLPIQRQIILETPDLEERLKHLIHFLMTEIQRHRRKKKK